MTTLQITATEQEREVFEAAAKAAGLSMSNYLRVSLHLEPIQRKYDPEKARAAGRLGGRARADRLSADERSRIARLGNAAKNKV